MSNVIQFRRKGTKADKPALALLDTARVRRAGKAFSANTARLILRTARLSVFLPLLWMRRPLRFLLGIALLGLFIAMPMIFFGMTDRPDRLWLFGIAGASWFAGLFFLWFYDMLLMRLSPQPIFLD